MWASDIALEARGLRAGYANQVILHDVSVIFPAGKVTTIIGPNGSGKSTLLKAIFGIAKVFEGSLYVDGHEMRSLDPRRLVAEGIAYVPQLDNVFPSLTVKENLEIGRAGSRKSVNEVLSLFPELQEKLHQRASRLSGGQRSMVAIARALMSGPRALLLDEISAGLAPEVAARVLEFLSGLAAQGLAIVLVEQNAIQALRICDMGYLLRDGRQCLGGDRAMWSRAGEEELSHLFLGGSVELLQDSAV